MWVCPCGSCVGPVWVLCGSCVGPVWVLCGSCVGPVWVLCGSCVGPVWVLCGSSGVGITWGWYALHTQCSKRLKKQWQSHRLMTLINWETVAPTLMFNAFIDCSNIPLLQQTMSLDPPRPGLVVEPKMSCRHSNTWPRLKVIGQDQLLSDYKIHIKYYKYCK